MGHTVLFRLSHSLGECGLVDTAVLYWTDMATTAADAPGPEHPHTLTTRVNLAHRLDVNGSHSNRAGDHVVWNERTHKHTFSEQDQDTVAYTPGDIPALPPANVLGEHYRGAFEAFCEEQAIKLTGEYRWIDPVPPTR